MNIKRHLNNFLRYKYLLFELVKKNIKLKYRRSYLGILWTLIEPLLTMIVLTLVFGTLFGKDDRTYPVYILCGRLLYSFFSSASKAGLKAVSGNAAMIKKVYVPKYIYVVAAIISNFVTFVISLVVLVGVAAVLRVEPTWHIVEGLIPLVILFVMTLGIGLILATLNVFFRDIEYIWSVLTMLIMYASAIFYTTERVINTGNGWVFSVNPIYMCMKKNVAVSVENVGMRFNLNQERVDNLKEYVIKFLKRDLKYSEFWALKDINFEIKKGQRLGVLGLNGSGKSTLLKVVSGVLKPSAGTVTTRGVVAPLLELGAGFSPEYTGRENIYLYGSVLGYTKEFLDEKFDEIVDFSELGEFIEVPIKNYSSGMKSRLGFSIATVVEPDILILDEVLSVGDKKFRNKSEKKIMSMFDKGVTVLFVSHSLEQVQRLCDRAIILDSGRLVASGSVDKVAKIYKNMTE